VMSPLIVGLLALGISSAGSGAAGTSTLPQEPCLRVCEQETTNEGLITERFSHGNATYDYAGEYANPNKVLQISVNSPLRANFGRLKKAFRCFTDCKRREYNAELEILSLTTFRSPHQCIDQTFVLTVERKSFASIGTRGRAVGFATAARSVCAGSE